jgi:hypothetical protein
MEVSGRLQTPGKEFGTHRKEGQVGPRDVLDALAKTKNPFTTLTGNRTSFVEARSLVSIIDWATPGPTKLVDLYKSLNSPNFYVFSLG